MNDMIRKTGRLGALLLVVALVAVACGDDDTSPTTTPGSTGGSVAISGSSTVEPISALVAEEFLATNPGVAISVNGPGTGDGFKLFCAGTTDISNASRHIKAAEEELCAAAGVEWIELQVAIDGISVITSVDNDFASCLDTADLYALLGDESIGFDNWSDANALAAEVGAPHAPYPDVRLDVTAPGEESGTFDSFVEFLIKGVAGGENYAETRGVTNVRPDYVPSTNDNVIITGVAGSASSLGWVGYAFYDENRDRVKALEISAGGGPCVAPSPATIADGSYTFSRPLFIYVNAGSAATKPEVAAFVDFFLSDDGLANVTAAGYVPLPDYTSVRQIWENRTSMGG
jgi:phosphate transport system substrate-binding protein